MRGRRWRSWLGAVVLGLGVVATMPARGEGPPGDKPAAQAKEPAEVQRLNAEVVRLYEQGKYDEALPLAERALALREEALGADHPDVGESLNTVALLYHVKGDYARAEPYYQRALSIAEKTLGPDHPDFAISLNNLAGLYHAKGDYAQAEPYYQRALSINEKVLEPDHPLVAISLDNLASLYKDKGDYARAETYSQRALNINEKALGPDHPAVATSLNNLALLYHDKGDDARAKPYFERALSIREEALGPDHPLVAIPLNNLAWLYHDKGDDAQAETYSQRALSIREETLGPDHPEVAISLNTLAWLYRDKGDYARAEPYLQRALSILEKALGPDHPDFATSLNHLALLYHDKGDYARAEPYSQRALSIQEKALGPDHPDLARSLDNLARHYVAQGRLVDAVRAQYRARAIQDRNAMLNLATGSEAQKRAYMATLRGPTYATVSLHIQEAPSNRQAARLALTTILQRKGRVLDAMADGLAALRRQFTPRDQALFDKLSSVRSELGVQLWRGPGKLSSEQYKQNLQTLEDERQKLEKKLGDRRAAFRAEEQPLTLERVQKAIPADAVLLEIFRYEPFNPKADPAHRWGRPRYVAYVLHRQGEPSFVDLGEAAPIHAAVQKLRDVLADLSRTHDPKAAARALDARVMQPIRALLGDTRWVLLSPDSKLNLVPFEALVDERGRYLIERFAFTYLTSGRDLIRLEEHAAAKQGTLIVANPDFSLRGASTPASGPDKGHRGLRSVDLTRVHFPPLPGTAEDARAIAQGLPGAQVLLAAQATEGAVKAVKSPRILHLATHGFFLPDQPELELQDERRSALGLEPTPHEIAALMQRENPLLRAGLALAGANTRVSGAKDDGILTAVEVSGLNLVGTKLVVLSACETGVGEAVSGEGVYGLRRALVMAGAETQVMSLWKVDTGYTRALMVAYYEKLKTGTGRSEAMRQAQIEMLGRKETSHPNVWASFIVSGDWRTLDEAPATPDFKVRPGPRGCACAQAGKGSAESWLGGGLTALALSVVAGRRRSCAGRGAERTYGR